VFTFGNLEHHPSCHRTAKCMLSGFVNPIPPSGQQGSNPPPKKETKKERKTSNDAMRTAGPSSRECRRPEDVRLGCATPRICQVFTSENDLSTFGFFSACHRLSWVPTCQNLSLLQALCVVSFSSPSFRSFDGQRRDGRSWGILVRTDFKENGRSVRDCFSVWSDGLSRWGHVPFHERPCKFVSLFPSFPNAPSRKTTTKREVREREGGKIIHPSQSQNGLSLKDARDFQLLTKRKQGGQTDTAEEGRRNKVRYKNESQGTTRANNPLGSSAAVFLQTVGRSR
jgi:hypothetical protein